MSVAMDPTPSTELRKGALGLGFIVFFVISAAGPLVAIAGGLPIGIMLGNGAGTPALLIATVLILLMFAAGYTAMSRYVTNAGGATTDGDAFVAGNKAGGKSEDRRLHQRDDHVGGTGQDRQPSDKCPRRDVLDEHCEHESTGEAKHDDDG